MNRGRPAFFYRNAIFQLVTAGTRWLDVGSGRTLLSRWLPNSDADQRELASRCAILAGIDVGEFDNPYLTERHVGDATKLPFNDNSFDLVTAHMVVEHLAQPFLFAAEAHRVLAPGGHLVISTPNRVNYLVMAASLLPDAITRRVAASTDGRAYADIFPTFYRMNTCRQLGKMANNLGFEVEQVELLNGDSHMEKIPVLGLVDSFLERLLRLPALASFRSTIVAVFRKPEATGENSIGIVARDCA